jgi:hypothetical protein
MLNRLKLCSFLGLAIVGGCNLSDCSVVLDDGLASLDDEVGGMIAPSDLAACRA